MPLNPKIKLVENILELKPLRTKPHAGRRWLGNDASRRRKSECGGA